MAFWKACFESTSVAPPMIVMSVVAQPAEHFGSWLWTNEIGPPLVTIRSPPSKRILRLRRKSSALQTPPVQRGLTGTEQRIWLAVPASGHAAPSPWFEANVTSMPCVIVSPAQADAVHWQTSPFAALPSPRIHVVAWTGASRFASSPSSQWS